jgi:hypothetical protein
MGVTFLLKDPPNHIALLQYLVYLDLRSIGASGNCPQLSKLVVILPIAYVLLVYMIVESTNK